MTRSRAYRLAAALGFLAASAWIIHGVFTSTNSTASIGLIFVPIAGAAGAAVATACCFVVFALKDVITGDSRASAPRALFALLALAGAGASAWSWNQATSTLQAASDKATPPDQLAAIRGAKHFFRQHDIDVALAQNPSTPQSILEEFANGSNQYLIRLVGSNPSTPVALLDRIVSGPLNYDRDVGAAQNPNLSRQSLERLVNVKRADFPGDVEYHLYQTFVLGARARRPGMPQDLFDRIAAWEQPEFHLVVAVVRSPQASCAQIARFLNVENAVLASTAGTEYKRRGCQQ